MTFLLDTNVLSEFKRPTPEQKVLDWLRARNEEDLFVCVVSFGELRQGVEMLEKGRRKTNLDAWLRHDLRHRFEGRILDVTPEIAETWGELSAEAKRKGLGAGVIDRYLAACAKVYAMTLVTRNIKDFEAFGLELANPWRASA